jgi:hypothetical protein
MNLMAFYFQIYLSEKELNYSLLLNGAGESNRA